jgi:hypothetical protein
MQKVRTRLVHFRVTEEEFERLKSACARQGARCLSEFVRNLMLQDSNPVPTSVDSKVVELDRRLCGLEVSISRLLHALAGSNTAVHGEGGN